MSKTKQALKLLSAKSAKVKDVGHLGRDIDHVSKKLWSITVSISKEDADKLRKETLEKGVKFE